MSESHYYHPPVYCSQLQKSPFPPNITCTKMITNVCNTVFWAHSSFRIIKNKEALSEIMQDFKFDSEECDWQGLPGGLQPPRHITGQQRWLIESALLQLHSWTPQLHLLIPLWPHLAHYCSPDPPRGLFTFWLCEFSSCVFVCKPMHQQNKQTKIYIYIFSIYVVKRCKYSWRLVQKSFFFFFNVIICIFK